MSPITCRNAGCGAFLVVDSKGLLYKEFKDELNDKGYKVHRISFINPTDAEGYNPLEYIRKDADGKIRYQDIIFLADILIDEVKDNKDPFWHVSAKNVLEFIIAYCMEVLPEEDHNMNSVIRLYHAFIKPNGHLAFYDVL